ncbi:MAG: ATP-dependent DNA helicase RecG [Treponema sp.]|uniref:ATP-dependent DNA helicase RecG n=1 Tax=Treponema sp. TaxID=166 RepID=UPI001DAA5F60|nr:ATP-dependent DNA helicase RecG [Treponema sp.]MBS7242570.1 ATP-dependent DNA helicase RecG [Treponema sp.]
MFLNELKVTVESLAGVGPATAKQFAKLNIFTVADLLSVYPRDYDDRTKKITLAEFSQHPKVHTICKVVAHSWFGYGKMKTLKIEITDGTANAFLIAFNRSFLEKSLPVGSIISVTGRFEIKYNEIQSTAFEASRLAYDGTLADYISAPVPDSALYPVYPLTEGLSQKNYRKTLGAALKAYGKTISDELPQEIIQERKLLPKQQALLQIHMPKNLEEVEEARRTLIYEELYQFEYKMALRALRHRGTLPSDKEVKESREVTKEEFHDSLSPRQKQLASRLTFELTPDQMKAIMDINADIDRSQVEFNAMMNREFGTASENERPPFNMQRLLQGDVGSGKTLVSFFACLRTIDYGGQCALLAPTELLARQHAENAAKLLEPVNVKAAFLTGNLKSAGRENLVNALRDGNIDLVIGTHALFSRNVSYKKLQLAIIDEQHRFGVAQRESIIDKGRVSFGATAHTPDVLMMSATPIPQTLALTAFGDLDVSLIKTMPKGRKPVKTLLTVMGNERNVYEAVRKELNAGHQAYFVYPRIGEETEDSDNDKSLKAAEEMYDFLSNQVYPGITCALIHGKVTEEEQKKILEDFSKGKTKVLIATTVVEVGVDVGNATCIVVEHADHFGLAELHQLRGRVGRSDLQSYCFLIYGKNITEEGKARLKALHESTDGFYIAEQDLKLRGPGEISGTSQSGYLTLAIADLARDKEILKIARYDAFKQLHSHEETCS